MVTVSKNCSITNVQTLRKSRNSRLRTKCSALNADLYDRNIRLSPVCSCTYRTEESCHHVFFVCPNFKAPRNNILQTLTPICNDISFGTIMYDDPELQFHINTQICTIVQDFISSYMRFAVYLMLILRN